MADEPVNGELVSESVFPVIREKNREFRGIATRGPKTGANFEANSECYREIPCATEQGIAFARTGNFEQQNRECIGAIRESSLLTRENLRSAVDRKLSAGIGKQAQAVWDYPKERGAVMAEASQDSRPSDGKRGATPNARRYPRTDPGEVHTHCRSLAAALRAGPAWWRSVERRP